MLEAILDFARELLTAAVIEQAMAAVVSDCDARIVAMDPMTGFTTAMIVSRGQLVHVNRSWRMIIEPIEHVALRPLCVVHERWSIV